MLPPESTAETTPPKRVNRAGWRRLVRLFSYMRGEWWRFTIALVALLIAGGLGLVYPKFFGRAIDAAFLDQSLTHLDSMAAVLMAVFLVQSVFIYLRHYLFSWLGEQVVARLRVDVYGHLLGMSQAYFSRTRSGELLSRLADDVTRLQDIVSQDLSIALRNSLTLVGGVGILFWINPLLTLAMLLIVPPMVVGATFWGRIIRRLSRMAQDGLAQASGTLQEGISGIETVQAFTQEGYEANRYRDAIDRVFALFVSRNRVRSLFMAAANFIAFAAVAGIFWLGGRMVVNEEISAGELTQFFLYTMAVAASVGGLAGLAGRYQQALGATVRIFEILDEECEIIDPPNAASLSLVQGRIRFDRVNFSYPSRDSKVIHNLDLEIAAGKVCAIVGASGSGKTTLGRLILRFWDPQSGQILLDERDIRTIKLSELREQMAIVAQDPVLFSGTILENIRYGKLDASREEIQEVAIAAHVDPFVREFADGYETIVGERGTKLSGGQRQRIALARAILRDPRVLILDEATSALDSESEYWIQTALETMSKGRTTLIIAHRLATVRNADCIVVLENGRIVEQGRHEELMTGNGAYARLVARQASAVDGKPDFDRHPELRPA